MSASDLFREAERWYQQAIEDLEVASLLLRAGKYAPACFHAQQSAEKGLKAVWRFADADPWGYLCSKLIEDMPEEEREQFIDFLDAALVLDKFYIPTRYPDALGGIIPAKAFTRGEAEGAIALTQKILDRVEKCLYQES